MKYRIIVDNNSSFEKEIVLFSSSDLNLSKRPTINDNEINIRVIDPFDLEIGYDTFRKIWGECGLVKSVSIKPDIDFTIRTEDANGMRVELPRHLVKKREFAADMGTCMYFNLNSKKKAIIKIDFVSGLVKQKYKS